MSDPIPKAETSESDNEKFQASLGIFRQECGRAKEPSEEIDDLAFFNKVVALAEDCFSTAEDFAGYVIPYFLSGSGSESDFGFWRRSIPDPVTNFMPLVKKWNLSSHPETVKAMMQYTSTFFSFETFYEKYRALIEEYMPEGQDSRFVFENFLAQNISFCLYPSGHDRPLQNRRDVVVNIIRGCFSEAQYLEAYFALKHHALNRLPSYSGIQMEGIETVAEFLMEICKHLPTEVAQKKEILGDVAEFLEKPEELFPHKEVFRKTEAERGGLIIYAAKEEIDPSLLGPDDYHAVYRDLISRASPSNIGQDIEILKKCGDMCLPNDDMKRSVRFKDAINLTATSARNYDPNRGIPPQLAKVLSSLEDRIFMYMTLTDGEQRLYRETFEPIVVDMVTNGFISDNEFHDILDRISCKLSAQQCLEWVEELTRDNLSFESGFVGDSHSHQTPFLNFLFNQLSKGIKPKDDTIISATRNIVAGRLRGELILIFAAATAQENEGQGEPVVMDQFFRFHSLSAFKVSLSGKSSQSRIKKKWEDRLGQIVSAMGREPETFRPPEVE